MTKPLALVFYESVLPGSQLVIRLQDMGYRVHTLANAKELVEYAEREKPLIILADLSSQTVDVPSAIKALRGNSATAHIPVVAFMSQEDDPRKAAAQEAGASLVVGDVAILNHLPQLLDQALHVE